MAWYIDSWAVLDGLAFASERQADVLRANTTVFMTVPDLEPIPIGRVSTALRAQRASFQDGFRNGDGEEFAFRSLDQVREVIRRGYLGGGLGPPPAPIEPRPVDPLLSEPEARLEGEPEPESPITGGEYYAKKVEHLPRDERIWRDYSVLQDPKGRRKLFEELHATGAMTQFLPYLRVFAQATLIEFDRTYGRHVHQIRQRELLHAWMGIMWSLGLWDSFDGYDHFVESTPLSGRMKRVASPLRYARLVPWQRDILFSVPCPVMRHWSPFMRRLSDKLLLPLVDRSYFDGNRDLPAVVPSLFCALVIVLTPSLGVSFWSDTATADRQRLLGRAMLWLTKEMPSVDLPADVEVAITDYAWGRLERTPQQFP